MFAHPRMLKYIYDVSGSSFRSLSQMATNYLQISEELVHIDAVAVLVHVFKESREVLLQSQLLRQMPSPLPSRSVALPYSGLQRFTRNINSMLSHSLIPRFRYRNTI